MRQSTLIIVVAMVAGIIVLSILGGWQVQRLVWKEALIAETSARIAREPLSITDIGQKWVSSADVDYLPFSASGKYIQNADIYYFNTLKGTTGWNVISPFVLDNGSMLIVNRGFVPAQLRSSNTDLFKADVKPQIITGLARNPIHEKPNRMMPDNQLEKREFYWKSQTQMAQLLSTGENVEILPFVMDAGASGDKTDFPKGGTTRISFPNNHLQYAVTWFGLALALLSVGSVFLYGRRKQRNMDDN